jgi:hypothetical protein
MIYQKNKTNGLSKCGIYPATKKNAILSFAGKWMKLENIILSDDKCRRQKVSCFLSYVEDRHNINI